ncbi:MAG: MoaD/ThiS family protein [Sphingomonadaceae bacterium]|nr:MoaD/ThiS family protein [Sphingomonadaceae bacterium]
MAKLVFLGRLADLAGRAEAEFGFSAPLDWLDVVQWLTDCFSEALGDAVRDPKVRVALNGVILTDRKGLELHNHDELAFLPPVSGG